MKRFKRIIGILCVTTILITGCSVSKSDSSISNKKNEVIKIVYPTSRGMGEKDISRFELWFNEQFPDAKLELASSSVTTISDAVKSDLKNNNGADIFVTTEYDTLVDEGYLAELTGFSALTNYRKSSVRALERDGKVYALPLGGGNMIALHYNKTLFDQYELEYPKDSESLYDIVLRIQQVIDEQGLNMRPLGGSLLYPSQASAIINGALSEYTQTADYLLWMSSYESSDFSFENPVFQNYLKAVDGMINKQKDSNGETVPGTGKLFGRDDYFSSQASSISSFLNGASFMYIGDATRCYDTFGTEGVYDKSDIALIGIPVGSEGDSYVSYMDELYMEINSEYTNYSERKKEIISELMDYISSSDSEFRNIFTFTADYCSGYIEGEEIKKNDDPYFAEVNDVLERNYVAQEINNTPFSNIFGKSLLAWRNGELGNIVEGDESDIEKITKILETYRNDDVSLFAKSEEPIGTSEYFMEYQSNIIRSQETELGNQIADMARDYMGTDFALMNAGGIRASVPKGDISVQTISSILPYESYLVKIKVSGATLKKALAHAYDVNPVYKSGQFGEISGLRVKLKTNDTGYSRFESLLAEWENNNPGTNEIQKNAAMKEIVEQLSKEDSTLLNLEFVEVTDEDGNPIEDDQIYTLATLDYLLLGGDDYNMLGILTDSEEADRSIEVYDREEHRITGTMEEMLEQIQNQCQKGADAFVAWVEEGHVLSTQKDGRIEIENFIYVE